MKVFTIGFTKKSARQFFESIKFSDVDRVIDVRLNNISQLAGFAKKQDLIYFLDSLCGVEYIHEPLLAPTQEMLDEYKKNGGAWNEYEKRFLDLMYTRRIQENVSRDIITNSCLLCSEDMPHNCHRRLVAEYLTSYWGDIDVRHLT